MLTSISNLAVSRLTSLPRSGGRRGTSLDDVQKVLETIRLDGLSSHHASSFVENVLWVCVTNHVDVCSEPLLERSSNEEAIGGKPLHERGRNFLADRRNGVE